VTKRKSRTKTWKNFYTKAKEGVENYPEVAVLLIFITVLLWPLLSNIVASHIDSNQTIILLTGIIATLLFLIVRIIVRSPEGQWPAEILLNNYRIRSISNSSLIEQANRITHEVFGDATVGDNSVEEILAKNKLACIGLLEESPHDGVERLVGYASCWPITKEAYERLRLGEGDPRGMSESALTASDVLSDMEIDKTEVLYIPSIAVLDRRSYEGRKRASVLICSFLQHIRTVYRPIADKGRTIRLFIVGFTAEGQKLTGRMAGHLGLHSPTGYLTLYEKEVPFYETLIFPTEWDYTVAKVEGAVFRSLFLPGAAA